jgi:predicted RNase H-like nuclease
VVPDVGKVTPLRKAHQDMLDAVLCVLIGLRWRLESLFVGDVTSGYKVSLASPAVRERLTIRARSVSVAIDGICPL